jgi:hypothetical protein
MAIVVSNPYSGDKKHHHKTVIPGSIALMGRFRADRRSKKHPSAGASLGSGGATQKNHGTSTLHAAPRWSRQSPVANRPLVEHARDLSLF